MPNIKCECCNNLFESHLMASCCICKKFFKNSCVGLSNSDIRLITANKGLTWTCTNCHQIGNDVNDLKALIVSLQNDIRELKQKSVNANTAVSNFNFEEVIEEINDRNKRKRNLIIFGLKEQNHNDPSNIRAENDIKVVSEVINKILPDLNNTNLKPIRLGRFDLSRAKPRPIKITLENEQTVHDVIRNVNKLKEYQCYRNISVSFDRTPKQINYYNEVKTELNRRISEGDRNCKIKFINGLPKIVSLN